jgi:DNA-3-methyladenine glycosylase II
MRPATGTRLSCAVALPDGFRADAVLDFHGRDHSGLAERVQQHRLLKGLMWEGRPACLSVRFDAGLAHAQLALDGVTDADPQALLRLVRHMLGLTQPIEAFESAHRAHPQIGPLIARQPGLRVPLSATPFEALTWAITGQQISLGAALSIRRKLIAAAGMRHSSGLACYPDAPAVAMLSAASLHQAGFSRAKAQTLMVLGRDVAAGHLPLQAWTTAASAEQIREQLLRVGGIGPWTVDYTLLRGYGWLDGSLHGDAAVRRQLQQLLGQTTKLTDDFTRRWLADFSPWRALLAAHLWAMPDDFSAAG